MDLTWEMMLRACVPVFAVATDDPASFLEQLRAKKTPRNSIELSISSGGSFVGDGEALGVGDLALEMVDHDPRDTVHVFVVTDAERWLGTKEGSRAIRFYLDSTYDHEREIRILLFVCSTDQTLHQDLRDLCLPRVSEVDHYPAGVGSPDYRSTMTSWPGEPWAKGFAHTVKDLPRYNDSITREEAKAALADFRKVHPMLLRRVLVPLSIVRAQPDIKEWVKRVQNGMVAADITEVKEAFEAQCGWPTTEPPSV